MYDPEKSRSRAFGEDMIDFYLQTEYEEDRPMGNVAISHLSYVISAWLVGIYSEVEPIIVRSVEWIERAISNNEKFGVDKDMYLSNLYWAKAIGKWMAGEGNVGGELGQAIFHEKSRWENKNKPWTINEILKNGLDDFMAFACQSDAKNGLEYGVNTYEEMVGVVRKYPMRNYKPRDYGYFFSLSVLGKGVCVDDELKGIGCRVLRDNLQEKWLGGGQFIRAATWLKIVYEFDEGGGLSPMETILRSYENMPNVKRPDFH